MTGDTVAPYPLLTRPVLLEKVWGGRRLAGWGKALDPGARVGESWELADLEATAASGAGGGAVRSLVANGPLAGRTLREALAAFGDVDAAAPLPLLCKLLDANEHLSVQVHPSPAYAAAHTGTALKSECWYVLEADAGARLFIGLRPGVELRDVPALLAQGRAGDALVEIPAIPGDCHSLPSGIVHALGAGVLVAEVQTPSDTTFRLYDWTREYGRPERALHVRESLEAALPELRVETRRSDPGEARQLVAVLPELIVERIRVETGAPRQMRLADRWCTVMVVAGSCRVADVPVDRGSTVALPGELARGCALSGEAELLVATAAAR